MNEYNFKGAAFIFTVGFCLFSLLKNWQTGLVAGFAGVYAHILLFVSLYAYGYIKNQKKLLESAGSIVPALAYILLFICFGYYFLPAGKFIVLVIVSLAGFLLSMAIHALLNRPEKA